VVTWEDVRALALALPETEEGTSYGRPCFKVRGKLFANLSPHEPGALVLKCDPEERPLLLAARPDAFFVTPHYEGYPRVLVNLDLVELDEIADRLTDSWLLAAPPRLVDAFEPS
jgi:hypothetical protein